MRIFLSFLAGKLRDVTYRVVMKPKKKRNYGACVFWAPVFFKVFWREK